MARTPKTILAIGQDLFSIDAYVMSQYNYSLHRYMNNSTSGGREKGGKRKGGHASVPSLQDPTPPVFMAYTDIQTLRGLDRPTDYGSGVEYADGILHLAKSRDVGRQQHRQQQLQGGAEVGLQLGLWLNGTEGCRDIVHHRLDAQIQRLVKYLSRPTSALTFDRVWLRIGYEFDNPSFGYLEDPELFREAFRTVVASCKSNARCGERTRFVWHSWAASVVSADELDRFYPGDDVVDWVGISIFSQLYTKANGGGVARLGNNETVRAVLEFAHRRRKPTMIAESTPFGGIPSRIDPWEAWFRPVLDLIQEHKIGMWSYINCDWESQPMWHQVGFGDTRLDSNGTVLRLWHDEVLQSSQFLSSWTRVRDDDDDTAFAAGAAVPLFSFLPRFSLHNYGRGAPSLSKMHVLPAALVLVLAFIVAFKTRSRFSTFLRANRRRLPVNERSVVGWYDYSSDGDSERGRTDYGAIQSVIEGIDVNASRYSGA